MSENSRHTGDIMKIETLRKLADREEIDYPFLISALHQYAHPRDKISGWLRSGELVRVKKGLYVFGKSAALLPYSHEILANLIYGPSAVSLSYALSFYGLIPERVTTITSVTNKRNKQFSTPAGHFIYYYLPPKKYAVGIELHSIAQNRQCLIATPEKALCDQIYLTDKHISFSTNKDIESYLFHDLRLDDASLKNLNLKQLGTIAEQYQHKKITSLIQFIKAWGK